jgi:hypothetical protein
MGKKLINMKRVINKKRDLFPTDLFTAMRSNPSGTFAMYLSAWDYIKSLCHSIAALFFSVFGENYTHWPGFAKIS